MRVLNLHGVLAEKVGQDRFLLHIETAAEAVRFLIANFPELEVLIASHSWRVRSGCGELGEDDLHNPVGSTGEIDLIPIIRGEGTTGKIIAGSLLIAASFFIPGAAIAGISITSLMFGMGVSLAISGVTQLLSPQQPTPAKERNPQEVRSFSISGVQNTSRQGTAVPVVFGEMIIGGIVISAGITTADLPNAGAGSQSYGSPRSSAAGKGSGK
jgi:predicted phage tail protein